MPTKSFFITVELTEEETVMLLNKLHNENSGVKIPKEVIEEVKREEEEGEKAILKWIKMSLV